VSQSDKQIYQNEFTRIRNAFGGDRGLFVVGLHSFMEMHMNRVMHDFEGEGGYNLKDQEAQRYSLLEEAGALR
jgi:uncharacterized protein (DUF927 family)